jgi:hypothetical protein
MDAGVIARFAFQQLGELFLWMAAAMTGFSVVIALVTALLEVIQQERR